MAKDKTSLVWEKEWDKDTKEIRSLKLRRLNDFLENIGLFDYLTEVIIHNFKGEECTFYKTNKKYGCPQDLAMHLIEELKEEMFYFEEEDTVSDKLSD